MPDQSFGGQCELPMPSATLETERLLLVPPSPDCWPAAFVIGSDGHSIEAVCQWAHGA